MTYPVYPGPFDPKPPEPEQVARELVEKELCTTAVCSFIGVGKGCHCFDAILAALTTAVAGRDARIEELTEILMVEDDEDILAVAREVMESRNYHASDAVELRATVERLRTALARIAADPYPNGSIYPELARAALAAEAKP